MAKDAAFGCVKCPSCVENSTYACIAYVGSIVLLFDGVVICEKVHRKSTKSIMCDNRQGWDCVKVLSLTNHHS